MATHMTLDDVASAFDIIEDHMPENILGEWEAPDEDTAAANSGTTRWQFPRFEGADTRGRCSTKAHASKGNHEQMKSCKGWVVDTANLYLSRAGLGPYDTDVETVCAWLDAPRNIVGGVLLLGDPGTGKTSLAQAAATHGEWDARVLTATPDHTKDSLLIRFMGEGKGIDGTAFGYGPVAQAVKDAADRKVVLIVDEFMLFLDGVKSIFYPLLDGNHWLPEANIDGSAMPVPDNFRLVVTSNPQVRGASLPEPIASRFASTTLTVETSEGMLYDLGIDDSIIAAWTALGTQGLWRPQVRELRLADYWLSVDVNQSVSAFVPEHCPESQRRAVRDTATGFLGGSTRDDGRLVVA